MKFSTKEFGTKEMNSLRQAIVFSVVCWLALGLYLNNMLLGAVLAIICFFGAFAGLLYYPKMKRKQYAGLVEANIPFSLMNIAIELNLGVSFLKAIEHASAENNTSKKSNESKKRNASNGNNYCEIEFGIVVKEVKEQGASMQDALRHFSERIDSRLVKRAVIQLSAAFEQGNKESGEPVKRIASEILTRQKVESKMFSGKLVVLSLLFIAVSAIVPALFQSFSIVGSAILHMNFTASQLFLIIAVGFPILDLAVLFYIKSKTPVFLRGQ